MNDFVGRKGAVLDSMWILYPDQLSDVQLTIAGFNGSTQIPSLAQAFNSLHINVTLPALKTNLLDSAALQSKSSFKVSTQWIRFRSSSSKHWN